MRVIGAVTDEVNGKIPVIAGSGSPSTQETVAFTKDAADLGVDTALVVTLFYLWRALTLPVGLFLAFSMLLCSFSDCIGNS